MNVRPRSAPRGSATPAPVAPASPAVLEAFPEDVRGAIRRLAGLSVAAVVLAVAFPYPITKAIVLVLLGLPLAGELFQRPAVALGFIALFLPVVDLVPPLPVPGLNAQTFVSLAAIVGALRLRSSSPAPQKVPYAPLFLALTALTLFALVLTLTTTYLPVVEVLTMSKNWLGYLPLFFFAARASTASWARRLVLAAVVTSAAGCALHSTIVFFLKGGGDRLRSTGLVGNQPNLYGGYLALVLPILVALALNGTGGRFTRLLAFGGSGLTFFALIFTKSRGAWLAFAAAVIAMIVLKRQVKLLALCLVLVVFAGSLMPQAFWQRLNETTQDESAGRTESGYDASTQSRITQWKAFPRLLAESPVWGHGLWTFADLIYEERLYHRRISPHSSIIRFGVEFGLLGLGLYFLLMFRMIWGAVKASAVATSVFDRSAKIGLVGAFFALLVADTSGARFFDDEIFAVFCILAGIVSGATLAMRTTAARAGAPAGSVPEAAVPAARVPAVRPRRRPVPARRG